MRTLALSLCALTACKLEDQTPAADAPPPPGTPLVTITSPQLNDSFYVTQSVQIAWTVDDDGNALSCDVSTIGTASLSIMSDVTLASGQSGTATWSLAGVAPGDYQIQIACTDDTQVTGTAKTGVIHVTTAPQDASFASQILPLLARCDGGACHDSVVPADGLDLTPANAHAALVGVASRHCTAYQLVAAGDPNASYLVFKLQGNGACMIGTRMPKPPETVLSVDELQLVRDWIANGAPNN